MADEFTRELSEVISGYQAVAGVPQQQTAVSTPISPPGMMQPITTQALPPLPPMVSPAMAQAQGVQAMSSSMVPVALAASAQQAQMQQAQNQMLMQQPGVSPVMGGLPGMAQGQAMAQSGYIQNTAFAAAMDPAMNFSSPGMMTGADFGVFRQSPVMQQNRMASMGQIAGNQMPLPLIPTPFGATSSLGFDTFARIRPGLQFQRGFDAQLDRGSEYARLMQGQQADFVASSGRALAGVGGMMIGNAAGTLIGGAIGGLGGAMTGSTIGSMIGLGASYIPGVDEAVGAAFRPAIERRADAIQAQYATRSFLVGGQELDLSGTGLSSRASQNMMAQFDRIAQDSGGTLNRRDITSIMQVSGEQGLLDFAQSGDQIAETVKNVTKLVGTMAEITGDPDFRENIKKIGQLRRMGFSTGEMSQAMQKADAYSRMAGMDVNQAMEQGGVQGASIFRSAGLDAASGLQTGMFNQGAVNVAVQSGAFDEQTLALYGGKSGVSQQLTELSAAFAAGPMQKALLPYMLTKGDDGQLTVDRERLQRLQRGDVTFEEAIQQGATRFQGDLDAIEQIQNRGRELSASATRTLGAEGLQEMMLMQGSIASERLGLSLTGGLQAMGASRDQARILARMAESPEYFNNLRQQQENELRRRSFDAQQAQETADMSGRLGFTNTLLRRGDEALFGGGAGRTLTSIGRFGSNVAGLPGNLQQGASNYLQRYEEDQRLRAIGSSRFRTGNTVGLTDEMIENLDLGVGVGGRTSNPTDRALSLGGSGQADLERLALNEGYVQRTGGDFARVLAGFGAGVVTGDMGAAADAYIADMSERSKSAREVAQSYRGAYRQSSSQRQGAAARLATTLAGGGASKEEQNKRFRRVKKVSRSLAKLAKEKNGIVFGQESITSADMERAMREAGMEDEEIQKVLADPSARADFLASAMEDMDPETRAQFRERAKDIVSAGDRAIGEGYLAGSAEGSREALKDLGELGLTTMMGFNAETFDDLTGASQGALRAISGMSEEDATALVAAAMQQEGTDAGKALMEGGAFDTLEGDKKLQAARARLAKLSPEERRQLAQLGGTEGDLEKITGRVRGGRRAMSAIALRDTMSQFEAVAQKRGIAIGGASSLDDMMEQVAGLEGEQAKAMGADVIAAARSGDRQKFARAMRSVRGVGREGLTLDAEGTENEATLSQKELVEATNRLSARFTKHTADNTDALRENTKMLKQQVEGEGASSTKTALQEY